MPAIVQDSRLDQIPEPFRERYLEITALSDAFCREHLNDEYRDACRRMAKLLCVPGSPVKQGKAASWACGIVYCVGQVNFLTDPSQTLHMRSEEIARGFGVSPATMQTKARTIRSGLELMDFDPEFTVPSRVPDNSFIWLLELNNGLIIDIHSGIQHGSCSICAAATTAARRRGAGAVAYTPRGARRFGRETR